MKYLFCIGRISMGMAFLQSSETCWRRGFLAGAIGGLVGSAAKALGEAIYPPRTQGQTPPPVIMAERVAGRSLSKTEKTASMQGIHYVFGAAAGGIYGLLAENYPLVRVGYGAGFGMVLLALTHESLVPLFKLSAPPNKEPAREHVSELVTHTIFGVTTELVRRRLRGA